jgi:hypothetical protein
MQKRIFSCVLFCVLCSELNLLRSRLTQCVSQHSLSLAGRATAKQSKPIPIIMSLTLVSRSLLNPSRAFPSLVRKNFHHPPNNSRPRRFSELTKKETSTQPPVLAVKESANEMLRHGPGDGVITLNVGGKEFHTLRSTINSNQVLRDHVTRAEANQEFMKGSSAIFIDRDPGNFGLILQHLRNQADNVSRFPSHDYFNIKHQVLIQVPKDKDVLRDLFVEARHYQIKELEDMLCSYDIMTRIASFFGGGSGNPFHAVTGAINNARRALMASGGVGVFMGSQNEDFMEDAKGLLKDVGNFVMGRKNDSSTSKQPPAEPTFAG